MTSLQYPNATVGPKAPSAYGRSLDILNRRYTLACFAIPPIVGSVTSVFVHGAALWALFRVGTGALGLSRDRAMLGIAAPLYLYCAAYLAAFALNPVTIYSWRHVPAILIFLLFPFLYSHWRVSRKAAVANAAIIGSSIACYGAFVLAAAQSFWLGRWAEGGAGNATVFATVTCLAALVALAGAFSMPRGFVALLLGAFLAAAVAILCSRSRTSIVALVIGAGIVLAIYGKGAFGRIPKPLLLAAFLAVCALGVFGYHMLAGRIASLLQDWENLTRHGQFKSSLGFRAGLWDIGLDLIRENPVFGNGPQWTRKLITEGFRERYGLKVGFSHFHNGLLTAWVETGIVGASALAAVFVVAIRSATIVLMRSCRDVERFGATILLIVASVYLIHGMSAALIGHDILDSVLVALLTVGTFLSSGTSALGDGGDDFQPSASDRQPASSPAGSQQGCAGRA